MKSNFTPKHYLSFALLLACATATPAWAGFFGPDVEILTPQQIRARLNEETLLVSSDGAKLKIQTKGAAVGGFLTSMIIGSALGSGGGGGGHVNAAQLNQQVQANAQIVQQSSASIQAAVKDVASSAAGQQAPSQAQLGPAPLLAHKLNTALSANKVKLASTDGEIAPSLQLRLTQQEWKLDFSMLSSDYTLNSALSIELIDKKANKIHYRNSCIKEFPKQMPLEAWELDNYQTVASAAEEIAQHCYDNLALALNLAMQATAPQDSKSAIATEDKKTLASGSPGSKTE